MPAGKAPRRSSLYRNTNKDITSPSGRKLTSGDMRPGSNQNLRLRKKLHETVNKKDGYDEYKKYEASQKARSLGKKDKKK